MKTKRGTPDIQVSRTELLPVVTFYPQLNEWHVIGRSNIIDPKNVYQPLFEAISDLNSFHIVFKFEYVNAASLKVIFDLLKQAKQIFSQTSKLKVKWYYDADDEDMKETGECLVKALDMKIDILIYNK